MPNGQFEFDERKLDAPERLVSALKTLPTEPVFIPGALDQAVIAQARRHLDREPAAHIPWLRISRWAIGAMAALLIVFFGTHRYLSNRPGVPGPPQTLAREDLNHDGRVDVLDAFILAKTLKSGPAPDRQMDINSDGKIDQADVAAIAAHAVRLGGRS